MQMLTAYLVLVMIICAGCTHYATVKKFDDLQTNDALVFGRIRILSNGEDITKYSNLVFNQVGNSSWSNARQLPLLPSEGVLSAGLPAGDNYFFHLISRKGVFTAEYRYDFKPDEAILHLPQPGGIYYIGDITVDWTPPKSKSGKTEALVVGTLAGGPLAGVVGALLMPYTGGEAVITVQDNREEVRTLFRQRFQTYKELTPAFLQLKTGRQPEVPSSP